MKKVAATRRARRVKIYARAEEAPAGSTENLPACIAYAAGRSNLFVSPANKKTAASRARRDGFAGEIADLAVSLRTSQNELDRKTAVSDRGYKAAAPELETLRTCS